MKKKFAALVIALPALLAVVSCNFNNGGSDKKDDEPQGYWTEGRDVQYVEGKKDTSRETYSETYTNGNFPLGKGGNGQYTGEVADPHIVRGDDGTFYIFATNRIALKSEDACNWEVYSTSIIGMPTWGNEYAKATYGSANLAVWAPDVMKIGDKWIYYYSLSGWGSPVGIGYAVADDAGGPYTDMGKLFIGSELGIGNCIDPCIFREGDDVYMCVGSFEGCYLVELNSDGMGLYDEDGTIEDPVTYAKDNKTLVAGHQSGWDGAMYEGSYIVKRGDYYYYFGSVGSCCDGTSSTYSVWVGRSENITGPYVGKDNRPLTLSGGGTTYGETVLWAGANSDRDYYGPGHNSIYIDDNGDWWMYYHAYIRKDKFATRHLMMDKINWDEDGYPVIGTLEEDGHYKKPSYDEELDGPALK